METQTHEAPLMKKCNKCGLEKPLGAFGKESKSKCGLKAKCKECEHAAYLLNRESHIQRVKLYRANNIEKIKVKKREYYNLNKEEINKRRKLYVSNNIDAVKQRQKLYRDTHKEEKALADRKYREKHRESILERKRKYYQDNKDSILEKCSEYRKCHKEEKSLTDRKYRESNKNKIEHRKRKWRMDNFEEVCNRAKVFYSQNLNKKMFQGAKARSKKNGLDFNITIDDIVIPEKCPVLGIPLIAAVGNKIVSKNSPSLDRIDSSKGYVKGNIRVVSHRANSLKSNATLEELRLIYEDAKKLANDHPEDYCI